MEKFKIVTDSCIDLPLRTIDELDIEVVPLLLTVNGRDYRNYPDEREIRSHDFYDFLRQGAIPTTSSLNPSEQESPMEKWLAKGIDVLCISFSSALSGTYQSAVIAQKALRERFPERKIVVIDSLCASMGQGMLVTYAARLQKAGKTIEEVSEWVNDHRQKVCHLFTVGDLMFLKRGGRLSSGKALLGTLFQMKPLLHVNTEGKLVPTGTVRGRRQAISRMVDRMVETIVDPDDQIIYISHGDCLEEAEEMRDKIEERVKTGSILINPVGPVIGSHSGVGTLALFYLGKDRTEE